jgi:hypothetical protein
MALIWSPHATSVPDDVLVTRAANMVYMGHTPLHESHISMLGTLSQTILNDRVARKIPQYVALAYWLRPAALRRLCGDLAHSDVSSSMRVPRGVALHLPPTNVDTIFVYSWAMSVLAGNTNIVRLPKILTTEAQWLVNIVSRVVEEYGESARHLFCQYSYGGETERDLAGLVDLRMIWGGDEKVRAAASVPIRPDGLSIGFPDRQSLAIISTESYEMADEKLRDALAASFFNDVFWFDQMGCGSPRLLVWLGGPGELAEDFYDRLSREITKREYKIECLPRGWPLVTDVMGVHLT